MFPKLFEIPFIHLTVKSYGLMMVIGFLLAVSLIRHLSRNITPDPQLITNAALYSLIGGVVGARLFYVVHYWEHFKENWPSVFAIWQGGLELYGGVILAVTIIFFYLWYHKLPIRRYLDILAIGLMLALVFGRIGCFLNGCCFGRPTELLCAVRFPYDSFAYRSQVDADLGRNRPEQQLELPDEFFGYYNDEGHWVQDLRPKKYLATEQKEKLKKNDKYRSLPVHPTQLYSSAAGGLLALILYLFWRRSQNAASSNNRSTLLTKPGQIFSLMFILYGITRFFMEFLRDDNPLEYAWWAIYKGGTVSQNLGIYMTIFGVVLTAIFQRMKSKALNGRCGLKSSAKI
jgi:phosphatidylglycerol:prolipoprotein diacylglycerol transferase